MRSVFRAVRASLRAELPMVAETADLIIVERAARPLGSLIRLKAPALRAVHAVERPVLVLEESRAAPRQVLVVVSEAVGERAIIAGARIAAAGGARLEVRVAGGIEPASRLEALLSRLAPGLPAPPHLAAVEGSLETLLRSVREALVVLDWSDRGPERAEDWRLVDEARCSVLVLR
ncbi:MAG: hypothetical protein IRY94_17205 [Rhodospirillaceae bacterium]|nr:hypothetical protein [Rhodospirillaceae bacterium]